MVIDGATGSELDRMGVDCKRPLWSANANINAPDVLKQVHKLYLEAGAVAVTTNTFSTHERKLNRDKVGYLAEELTKKAVQMAVEARNEVNPDALVLGCISPLSQCYAPKDAPDFKTCKKEHLQNCKYLLEAGADFLWIETACSKFDALAAVEACEQLAPGKWGISFSLPVETVGIMRCGTPIADIVHKLAKAAFIGVNCMDGKEVARQVQHLKEIAPEGMRIAAYGNIGYWVPPTDYKAGIKKKNDVELDAIYACLVKQWIEAGASIVGGCCGTSPDTIRMLHAIIKQHELSTTNSEMSD